MKEIPAQHPSVGDRLAGEAEKRNQSMGRRASRQIKSPVG